MRRSVAKSGAHENGAGPAYPRTSATRGRTRYDMGYFETRAENDSGVETGYRGGAEAYDRDGVFVIFDPDGVGKRLASTKACDLEEWC